jgi:hypothetical protein
MSSITRTVRRGLRRRDLTRGDFALRTLTVLVAVACFGYGLFVAAHGSSAGR